MNLFAFMPRFFFFVSSRYTIIYSRVILFRTIEQCWPSNSSPYYISYGTYLWSTCRTSLQKWTQDILIEIFHQAFNIAINFLSAILSTFSIHGHLDRTFKLFLPSATCYISPFLYSCSCSYISYKTQMELLRKYNFCYTYLIYLYSFRIML